MRSLYKDKKLNQRPSSETLFFTTFSEEFLEKYTSIIDSEPQTHNISCWAQIGLSDPYQPEFAKTPKFKPPKNEESMVYDESR